jgi:hypothetical protein
MLLFEIMTFENCWMMKMNNTFSTFCNTIFNGLLIYLYIYNLLHFQSNLYVKLLWFLLVLPNDGFYNMPTQLESTVTVLLIKLLYKYIFFSIILILFLKILSPFSHQFVIFLIIILRKLWISIKVLKPPPLSELSILKV